jgi:hypothetical protein
MRPRNILDWHFDQITCRKWRMMLFPLGGSTTLSVTGSVPLRVAVMGASIDFWAVIRWSILIKASLKGETCPTRPCRDHRYFRRIDFSAHDDNRRLYISFSNERWGRACSVNVQAPNVGVAEMFVRQNWSMIEAKARDGLINKSGEDRTIKLATPRGP